MQRSTKLIAGVIVLAGAAWGLQHSLQPVQTATAPPVPPVPVVVTSVQQTDVPIILNGLGTVQALNTAVIRSQVTGLLQSVNFTEGQQVKRGDLLAQIDPRPQQAALEQARAMQARDQAHLANAQTNLNRNLSLLSKGFATEQQVTDEQSQVVQLQNDAKSDAAAADNAQTQLSYTSLVAPFDGVTGIGTLDVGNIIHPTDATGLVTVTQVQPITVVFTLPAANIQAVQEALATGPVTATAYDQTGTRLLDRGTLLLINNQADPTSGTVQLKAVFPNGKRFLWPGTFANVTLTLRTVHDGLTIPTDAVQQGTKGPFVFVVGPDNKVTDTSIEVQQRDRGTALVSHGLQPNQRVVEQGQYNLVDGTAVVASTPDQVANASPATSGLLP